MAMALAPAPAPLPAAQAWLRASPRHDPPPPLLPGTMNLVTTLVNTLEGLLKPENLSNKADQVRAAAATCHP